MSCRPSKQSNPPAIPAAFFGISHGPTWPSVTTGALGHPATLAWGFIEKLPGIYDFTSYDHFILEARDKGLVDSSGTVSATITFGYTPQFHARDTSRCILIGDRRVCPSPPSDLTSWTNLLHAVINHYNGVTAPHVKFYELWNEFSSPNFWTGTNSEMIAMASAAYPIIHQDPHSLLLTPSVSGPAGASGTLPDGLTWMQDYLRAGGASYADGGTFHGYIAAYGGQGVSLFPMPEQDSTTGCAYGPACFGSIVTKTQGFRQVFDSSGLRNKPMLDTEGSWGKDRNLTDPATQSMWVSRWTILQASYYPSLAQIAWFGWDLDGGTLSEAAQISYNQTAQWLIGSSFSTGCSVSVDVWSCPLSGPSGPGLLVWSTSGSSLFSRGSWTKQYDLRGTLTRLTGSTVPISGSPTLLK